jgi:hypothetical protein
MKVWTHCAIPPVLRIRSQREENSMNSAGNKRILERTPGGLKPMTEAVLPTAGPESTEVTLGTEHANLEANAFRPVTRRRRVHMKLGGREMRSGRANSESFDGLLTRFQNAVPATSDLPPLIDGNISTVENKDPGTLPARSGPKKLPGPLREFLDACVIPALVEKYLATRKETGK